MRVQRNWKYPIFRLSHIWLVVSTYPSEKYESQVGWLFPTEWQNKTCSKPPSSISLQFFRHPPHGPGGPVDVCQWQIVGAVPADGLAAKPRSRRRMEARLTKNGHMVQATSAGRMSIHGSLVKIHHINFNAPAFSGVWVGLRWKDRFRTFALQGSVADPSRRASFFSEKCQLYEKAHPLKMVKKTWVKNQHPVGMPQEWLGKQEPYMP